MGGHTGGVNTVEFSPCGNFFGSGGADQMVMVWKSNMLGLIPGDWERDKIPKVSLRRLENVSAPTISKGQGVQLTQRIEPPRGSSVQVQHPTNNKTPPPTRSTGDKKVVQRSKANVVKLAGMGHESSYQPVSKHPVQRPSDNAAP